jgi:hypothetical protein
MLAMLKISVASQGYSAYRELGAGQVKILHERLFETTRPGHAGSGLGWWTKLGLGYML